MKLLFTSFLILVAALVHAQPKKPLAKPTSGGNTYPTLLQGLGQFKINKSTTAIISELCKELHTHLQYANSQAGLPDNTDSTGVYLIEYRPVDDPSQEISQAQACGVGKVYYVTNYEISNLPIRGMYLTFYNNLLVKIELSEPGRFPEAFSIKYGKPQQEHKTKPATCIYTHTGNKIVYKDEYLFETWHNSTVSAVNTIIRYYDGNCEKQFASKFIIQDEAKVMQLEKCSVAVASSHAAKQIKATRKGLSDL